MERIIRIDGFSNKKKKDSEDTFPCFECFVGGETKSIGVFEKEIVTELKQHIDQWVKVVAPQRPNGYINITHFVALATKEEIPNLSEQAKAEDAEPITQPTKVSQIESIVKVPSEITTRIMHELVDNRIVYNRYEFGAANDRHTIKYKDVADFKKQYKEIVEARRVVDTEINPKQ